MMQRRFSVLAVACFGLGAISLLFAVSVFFRNPRAATFRVTLPAHAEVFPSALTQPVLKIEVPWSMFNAHAARSSFRVLVFFGGSRPYGFLSRPTAEVEGYLSRGDGAFYWAHSQYHPDWPTGFMVGNVERNGDRFVAYPALAWDVLGFQVAVVVICGVLGGFIEMLHRSIRRLDAVRTSTRAAA